MQERRQRMHTTIRMYGIRRRLAIRTGSVQDTESVMYTVHVRMAVSVPELSARFRRIPNIIRGATTGTIRDAIQGIHPGTIPEEDMERAGIKKQRAGTSPKDGGVLALTNICGLLMQERLRESI